MSATSKPIPITGVSLCNATGGNIDEIRVALGERRTGLSACEVDVPFETAVGAIKTELPELPPALAPWSTRTARIAHHLMLALEPQLERVRQRWSPQRVGIFFGTSTAGADRTEQAYRVFLQTKSLPEDYDLWRHHTYGASLHVMRELGGFDGPAWMISTACTSSAKPLATAQRLIEADCIDAALVGGIDTLCAMTLCGFRSLSALSSNPCRPFSAARDGISIGEAGALLLLERQGDPMALLESVGESSDAYHISAPHPEGLGAKLAMTRALERAGVAPGDVDHVNAHGTGTQLNDVAEARAIADVFGNEVPVVSTKGYTGHTLGAAGGTEAVLSVMAILDDEIPASLGAAPLDEKITINVAAQGAAGRIDRVLSNSFAFGGNNVSVLLRSP